MPSFPLIIVLFEAYRILDKENNDPIYAFFYTVGSRIMQFWFKKFIVPFESILVCEPLIVRNCTIFTIFTITLNILGPKS